MDLIVASSCESFRPTTSMLISFSFFKKATFRCCTASLTAELVTFGITLAASNGSPAIHSFLTYVPWCIAGRNPALQSGLPMVIGWDGHNTTYPGRFWFSNPSPYVIQAPIEGRPMMLDPVFI